MEVKEVVQDGRIFYEVRFNEQGPILGCFNDTDCPGMAQLCALNETWSPFPSQCTCDATLGFGGFNCDQPGPLTYFLAVTMIATLVIIVLSMLVSGYSLISLLRVKQERKLSSLTLALAFSTFTCLEFSIEMAFLLLNALAHPARHRISLLNDGNSPTRLMRRQEHGDVHVVMLILAFIFTTVTVFFLAGVWTAVAVNYKRMSVHQGKLIEKCCLAYLVFAVCVLIPTSTMPSLWAVSSIIVFIVTAFLCVACFVVAFRISRVNNELQFNASSSNNAANNNIIIVSQQQKQSAGMAKKMERLLKKIASTALALGFLCLLAAITLGVYGIGPARRPTLIPPLMSKAPREISYRLGVLTFSLINAVVTEYLFATARNKLAASLPPPTTVVAASGNNKTEKDNGNEEALASSSANKCLVPSAQQVKVVADEADFKTKDAGDTLTVDLESPYDVSSATVEPL